ncbi:MAG: transglycosylase SLT domain-containing protein [Myxococcaceae bacterium]|nr:transglycosylase SLT domain-containing protein [Myxococcaceae bacterium]
MSMSSSWPKSIAALALALLSAAALAQETLPPASSDEGLEEDALDPGFIRVPNPAFPSPEKQPEVVDRGRKLERSDLEPYFAAGKRAEAKAAYDARKWADVKAALRDEGDAPPVRWLRALAASQLGEHLFAAAELEAIAAKWPAFKDRCLVLSGQEYEDLKDWASAARVYVQVAPTSRQAFDAALGLSRAYRFTKQVTKARDVLVPFSLKPAPPWGRDVGAEALLQLADLAAARKDVKAEADAAAKLWSLHPRALVAQKLEVSRVGPITNELTVARADQLIEAHRNQEGIDLLTPIIGDLKLPDALACRGHFALGKGQRKQRQHAKAVATLAAVVKKCTDADLKARAAYVLGFSRSVLDPKNGALVYEQLAKDAPSHPFADDALFYAADGRLRSGDLEGAKALLAQLVEKYPNGDWAAEALFRQAWLAKVAKAWPDAKAAFEGIEQKYTAADDPYEVERAQYWRGRVLEAAGDAKAAAEVLADVAVNHPATYYGLMARERVMKLDAAKGAEVAKVVPPAPKADDVFPLYAGPLGDEPGFLTAIEWLRLGISEQVPLELLALDRSKLPRESLRLIVYVISLSGEERSAHGMARLWLKRDLSGRITEKSRALWEIAYPNAYRDLVVKHASAAKSLDPDLLQALMREESALDPKALSWAGALGLTQLMPTTAWDVAAKLKLPRPSQDQLLDPDLNIRIGATYLSGLVQQFKGIKQYAVASYNAGPGAVNRWRAAQPDAEIDEWVEEIPLTETRGYVKRVLRSYNTYKLLYGAPEAVAAPLTSGSQR